jgi:hypothetical protein
VDFYKTEIWKEKRLMMGISFLETTNRKSDSIIDRHTEMIHALRYLTLSVAIQRKHPLQRTILKLNYYKNTLQRT